MRHYGLAAVFFTPLAIFLAELATYGQSSPAALIEARFFDYGTLVRGGLLRAACACITRRFAKS